MFWLDGIEFEFSFRLRFLHLDLIRLFCWNLILRVVCTRLRSKFAWRDFVVCWHFRHLFEMTLRSCRYRNGHLFVHWAIHISVIDWVICYTTGHAFRLKSWFHCAIIFVHLFWYSGLSIWPSFIDSEIVWVWFWNFVRVGFNWLFNLNNFISLTLKRWLWWFCLFELSDFWCWWTFSFLYVFNTDHL